MARAVGIDIGSHSIKLVEIQERKGQLELIKCATNLISGDDIKSSLNDLIALEKLLLKRVNISVSGPFVIVRYIDMPSMKKEELKSAIRFEAEKYIPFDIKEAIVDCAMLDNSHSGVSNRVLLVAAKRERLSYYTSIFKELGIEIEAIDVDTVAIFNAFQGVGLDKKQEYAYAILNIGAKFSNMNIVIKNCPCFTRDILCGGFDITNRIKDSFGIGFKEAEELKLNPGEKMQDISRIITPVLERLASEIRMSFDYFETQFGTNIERLYISGGSSYLFNIKDFLKDSLGMETLMWNPFEGIKLSETGLSNSVENSSAQFAVAVGLALRK
jgi:type IV pilus assembly protein PilM